MKHLILRNILTLIGGIIYVVLFYHSNMGINSLIFVTLLSTFIISREPSLFNQRSVQLVFFGTMLAAVMVVIHNTPIAKFTYSLSFICLIGILQLRTIRFLGYGFALGLLHFCSFPLEWIKSFQTRENIRWSQLIRWGKILLLPILIVPIFLMIYASAVPTFGNFIENVIDTLTRPFEMEGDLLLFVYFFWGILLTGSFLFPSFWKNIIHKFEGGHSFEIVRKKKPLRISYLTMGLKQEYFAALLTITLLNVLLFTTNIFHVWELIDKMVQPSQMQNSGGMIEIDSASSMSGSIHAATEALCFSIFLAIGVVVVFFRKNLNFFPDNKYLRWLAYGWIAQNALLALITFGHDYLYFFFYGMTEYRLFIVFFLLLVGAGLVSVYFKIRFKKSTYFLLTANAWIIYIAFVAATCFNWSAFISHYNLNYAHQSQVDVIYLYQSLSDKNIPYILKHQQDIPQAKNHTAKGYQELALKNKIERFTRKYNKQKWTSWNLADYRTHRAIKRYYKE